MPRLRELWFDLPPQLEDVTEYFFTSEEGPILVLPLVIVPIAADDVDPWLVAAREKAKLFAGVRLSQLKTYENPRYRVRGFEADFGSSLVVTVLVSLGHIALEVTTKCRPGYEPQLQQILRSLRREGESESPLEPQLHSYAAAGFRFESTQILDEPAFLSLRSKDGALRILGKSSAKRQKRIRPAWGSLFGLGPADVVTETLQGRRTIVGQASPTGAPAPSFQSEYWLAIAQGGQMPRALCVGQALGRSERSFFGFEMKGEGPDGLEQVEVWSALLRSARGL